MSQERLDGLAMLAIEKSAITPDIEERIIKDFLQRNARRRTRFRCGQEEVEER